MERLSILYASALFDLALENGAVKEFHEQSLLLRDVLQDDDCMRVLHHPHISAAEKCDMFRIAFEGHIHTDLLGFLFLTTEKNRETYLIPALTALIEKIERYNNKVIAKVKTAVQYNEKQTAALRETLSRKLNKHVELSMDVEPSLVGGPYIFVDGYYIDWTVKKRLRDLTVHMKEGCSV